MKTYKPKKMGRRTRKLQHLLFNTNFKVANVEDFTKVLKVKSEGISVRKLVKQGYKLVILPKR